MIPDQELTLEEVKYYLDPMRAEQKYPGRTRLYSRIMQLLEAERDLNAIKRIINPPAQCEISCRQGSE